MDRMDSLCRLDRLDAPPRQRLAPVSRLIPERVFRLPARRLDLIEPDRAHGTNSAQAQAVVRIPGAAAGVLLQSLARPRSEHTDRLIGAIKGWTCP